MSWGGWLGGIIAAVEDRVSTLILLAGGVLDVGLPEMNPLNYVTRIDVPLLVLNGEYDTILNYEYNAKPMAELVATPPEHVRLKAYPTDHIPPKAEYVKEILDWLDKYFGPVRFIRTPKAAAVPGSRSVQNLRKRPDQLRVSKWGRNLPD